jgi:hypothetical protein
VSRRPKARAARFTHFGVLTSSTHMARLRQIGGRLDARAQFSSSTLADLYDADVMPWQLRKAHRALDRAVDKLYRSAPFTGDRDRAEHLFGLYERLVAPLVAANSAPPKRLRKSAETADRGSAPRKRRLQPPQGDVAIGPAESALESGNLFG